MKNKLIFTAVLFGLLFSTDNSAGLMAQKAKSTKSTRARSATKKKTSLLPGQYPESTERLLTEKDVEHQTPWGMKVMLNEIYARHGYVFRDADLKKHFRQEKWYRGKERNLNRIKLSPTEIQNIAFIKDYQQHAKL